MNNGSQFSVNIEHGKGKSRICAMLLILVICILQAGCGITVERTGSAGASSGGTQADSNNAQASSGGTQTEESNSLEKEEGHAGGAASEYASKGIVLRAEAVDDFYSFVNAEELSNHLPKYGQAYGGPLKDVDDQIQEEIVTLVRGVAEHKKVAGKELEENETTALVREVYLQYLDFLKSGAENASKRTGYFDPLFQMEVDRNYFRAGENALYLEQTTMVGPFSLKDVYEESETQKQLFDFAVDALVSSGEEPERAKGKAKDFVLLVLDVAFATDFSIQEAENPYVTFSFLESEKMDELLPNVKCEGLDRLLGIQGKNPYGGWMVQDASQAKALDECMAEEHEEATDTWLLCEYLYSRRAFLMAEHPFLKQYVTDLFQEPEARAALYVNEVLPEQVSELYVEAYYTEDMKAFLDRLYGDVKESYRELIGKSDWLSVKTRQGLLRKLEKLEFIKPDQAVSTVYERKEILGATALETYDNIKRISREKNLALAGKPQEKHALIMPSQMMNAGYRTDNIFAVTVAILHSPYYDKDASYETNLGGIGMVMAHEIGHAFDSNCILFDAEGNYDPEWISQEDREILRARQQEMIEYYNDFTVLGVYHVDGEKTCGENYADKGAMECLMNIAKSEKGRRELFENYAKVWCLWKEDASIIGQLSVDEHSPERIRVNAVLSATDEFYELYGVKEGDGMYVQPERRVHRW